MQTLVSSIVIAVVYGHSGSAVPGSLMKILIPCVVMVSLILALGLVLFLARRKYFGSNAADVPGSGTGFDIEQIESLRNKGKISDKEFHDLRQGALGLDESTVKTVKKDNSSLSKAINQDD